jgi:hypothetical protein
MGFVGEGNMESDLEGCIGVLVPKDEGTACAKAQCFKVKTCLFA